MPLPDLVPSVAPEGSPPLPQSVISDAMAGGPPSAPPTPAQPAAMPTVRANYSVTYPQGMVPSLIPNQGGATEETARIPKSKAEYLNELAARAQPGQFKYVIRRIRPPVHDGYRLMLAPIGEMEPLPFEAAKEAVREWYGGGEYQILVRNADGNVVDNVPLSIDLVQYPPKIPPNSQRVSGPTEAQTGYSSVPGMSGGPSNQPEPPELAEVKRLRMEEQRELQQEQTQKAQLRRLKAEREFQKEAKSEGDADMQAAQALREQMNQLNQNMMQGLERLTTALSTALTAPKEDKLMPMLLESMKESREQQRLADERLREQARQSEERDRLSREETTKLMLTVLGAKNNPGDNEIVKAVLAANQQATQAAVEAGKKESGQLNRLVELLFENKLGAQETNLKQMLDLMDRGEQRATERIQMVLEMRGQDENVINADNGFWTNFGNMFLGGLNKLFSGLSSGVAGKLGGMGGGGLPMLPAPQQSVLIPADGQVIQPQASAPMYTPAPQPVQQPVYQPVQQMQPVQQVQQVQPETSAENVVSLFYDGVLQDVSRQQAQPAQQAPGASSSQMQAVAVSPDLSEHVTEAMRMAIADITAGRSEQDWADYAQGKWGNFLQVLVAASDDASRLRLIQGQCAPAVYEQFRQLLNANPVGMRNFVNSLHAMLSEFQREFRHGVA